MVLCLPLCCCCSSCFLFSLIFLFEVQKYFSFIYTASSSSVFCRCRCCYCRLLGTSVSSVFLAFRGFSLRVLPDAYARHVRGCVWVILFHCVIFFPLPVRFVNAGKHKTSNVNWKSFVCETECVISWSVYHFLQLLARACFKKFDSFPLFCSFLFLFVWRVNLSLNFWREVRGLGARRRGLVVCRTPRHALTVQCFVKSFISDSKTHEAHVASSSRLQLQLLYFSVWVSNFPFHVNMNAKYLSVNNSGSSTQCLSYGSLKWQTTVTKRWSGSQGRQAATAKKT